MSALKLHTIKDEGLSGAVFKALASIVPCASDSLSEGLFGDALMYAVFVLKSHFVIPSVVETVCEFMEALSCFGTCMCVCMCEGTAMHHTCVVCVSACVGELLCTTHVLYVCLHV